MASVPRVFFQTVIGFVFNSVFSGLFGFMPGSKPPPLNHKTVNHTVENGVVVKTFATVVQEVF
ncbi:Uncharacterised protein [Salmonella bongori]|nr:Uncharacterised protein [Salmonella bongori]